MNLRYDDANRDDPPAVRSLMRTDVTTAPPDTPLGKAIEKVLESESGAVLVVAEGKLVGIVTERDLLAAVQRSQRNKSPGP